MAVHLGVVDEEKINEMSYIFFEDILTEQGHKLTYDAVVNYAGNSFCSKSWDMIVENNPFNLIEEDGTNRSTKAAMAKFFNSADVKIVKKAPGPAMKKGK